jgi:hypothetical protein
MKNEKKNLNEKLPIQIPFKNYQPIATEKYMYAHKKLPTNIQQKVPRKVTQRISVKKRDVTTTT